MVHTINKTKFYVLYDQQSPFAIYWLNWVLKRDQKDRFLAASLQSGFGRNFLVERGLHHKANAIYLWKPESFYLVNAAAINKMMKNVGGRYALLAHLNILPAVLGDKFYEQVAARQQNTMAGESIPAAAYLHKILD